MDVTNSAILSLIGLNCTRIILVSAGTIKHELYHDFFTITEIALSTLILTNLYKKYRNERIYRIWKINQAKARLNHKERGTTTWTKEN